jgi:dipeptidyl aminopeptidase/acylaminoacyl peptidase
MSLMAALTFTVGAMYRLRGLDDPPAFSPHGRRVAFVVKRPLHDARNMEQLFLNNDDVADVYVADLRSGRVTRITDGSADRSGFWDPQWSPDGKRIAMLSTRGGNVFLWTWDAADGLRRVTDRAVDSGFRSPGFFWAGDARIVCTLLPAGKKPLSMTVEYQTPLAAMHEWPLEWRGRVSTASVLQSGLPVNLTQWPHDTLEEISFTGTGQSVTRLADAVQFQNVTPSRGGRRVAAYQAVGLLQPRADRRLPADFDNHVYQLSVYDLRSGKRVAHFPSPFVGYAPLSWSYGDGEIGLIAQPVADGAPGHLGIYRCSLATNACGNVLPSSLDVDVGPNGTKSAPLWTANGDLVAYAHNGDQPFYTARWNWYAVDAAGGASNLTATLANAPASLVAVENGRTLLGISGGRLDRVYASGHPSAGLVSGAAALTSILWPERETSGARIVVAAGKARTTATVVDLASGRTSTLVHLREGESVNAFSADGDSVVTVQNADDGSFLRFARAGGTQRVLYAANRWLAHYAAGRAVHYSYTSAAGKPLTAWALLPPGYVATHRYPAVVWEYPGSVMSPQRAPFLASLNLEHALNLQLLAARGYVVLFPSIPLPPFGEPSDPYAQLTGAIMPAVDRAAQLGYVDPNRVAVMGQSYGGFGAYALVTQTDRFKAAIALAGISDWTSLYGTFDARQRYQPNVIQNDEFAEQLMEDGQGNFGAPPWVDPARYERNSPLTYVANVHTPVLIIQGDLDYVSMTQGEEFFTALYRQGKRAEFVRYWGEDHVLRSEANVRDCWQRIAQWLKEFLR